MSDKMDFQNILIERRDTVGIITLNRPAALNALNAALIAELALALDDKQLAPPTDYQRLLPTEAQVNAEVKTLEQMYRSNASPVAIGAVQDFQRERNNERRTSRTEITLQALQHLARYLSGIPARKNVIWLSDTFQSAFSKTTELASLLTRRP